MELPLQQPCIHEEVDTRLAVHVFDTNLSGHKQIKNRSNDTDMVLLAISVVNTFLADELGIAYGTGKLLLTQFLCAYRFDVATVGQDKSSVLLSAWEVWKMFPELTPSLRALAVSPKDISEEHIKQFLRSL